jgi:TetR/AcrR family transcriptional regulator, regulator of autoinduction and epiphytic fitness
MPKSKASSQESDKNPEKAEMILALALQEFLKHGYMGTSMDQLAKATGVSKPTLYSYFSDKETLFKAVAIRRFEEFNQNFEILPQEVDLSQPSRIFLTKILKSVLAQIINTVDQHHDFVRLIIGESGRFPDLAQNIVKLVHKPIIERLAYFLTSHPQIKCDDPFTSATLLMGGLMYYMITQKIFNAKEILPLQEDVYLDNLVNLICQ